MIMKNYYAMYKEGERERENLLTLSLWSITLHEQRMFDYLAPEL
jgi:hypothetical protein